MYRRLLSRAVHSRRLVALTATLTIAMLAFGVTFYALLHFHGIYTYTNNSGIPTVILPLYGGGSLPEDFEVIPIFLLFCVVAVAGTLAVAQHKLRCISEAWLDVFVIAVMSLAISVTLFS